MSAADDAWQNRPTAREALAMLHPSHALHTAMRFGRRGAEREPTVGCSCGVMMRVPDERWFIVALRNVPPVES